MLSERFRPNCSQCAERQVRAQAQFINVKEFFKSHRFLCAQCAKKEFCVIPFSKSIHSQTKFSKNIVANSKIKNSQQTKKHILDLYISKNMKKLYEIEEFVKTKLQQWRKEFEYQLEAILGTFDPKTATNFVDLIRATHKCDLSHLGPVLKSLQYSGIRNFGRNPEFIQSVEESFNLCESLLQTQWKTLKLRFETISFYLNNQKPAALYDKKIVEVDKHNRKIYGKAYEKRLESEGKREDHCKHIQPIEIESDSVERKQQAVGDVGQKQENLKGEMRVELIEGESIRIRRKENLLGVRHKQVRRVCLESPVNIAQTFQFLKKCFFVQTLHIGCPQFTTSSRLKSLISQSYHLKKLEITCPHSFDSSCVQAFASTGGNLSELVIGTDYELGIATLDEESTFKEYPLRSSAQPLYSDVVSYLIQTLPKLEHVWIANILQENLIDRVTSMESLKHLSLGSFQGQHFQIISERSWEILSSVSGLESLALGGIQLKAESLVKCLIANQATLQRINIHSCSRIDNQLFEQRSLHLEQIRVYRGQLTARSIWGNTHIKTLVLRQCNSVDIQFAETHIMQLSHLTHLSLLGSRWVTDSLISRLKQIPSLRCLNIGHTMVSMHCIQGIEVLRELKTLHIGNTKIRGLSILQLADQIPQLEKLSLSGHNGIDVKNAKGSVSSKQVRLLGGKLPKISHLDVSGCYDLEDDCLDTFSRLQFVDLWNTKVTQGKRQELRERGVIVYDQP